MERVARARRPEALVAGVHGVVRQPGSRSSRQVASGRRSACASRRRPPTCPTRPPRLAAAPALPTRATPRRTTMRSSRGRRRPNPTTRHNEIRIINRKGPPTRTPLDRVSGWPALARRGRRRRRTRRRGRRGARRRARQSFARFALRLAAPTQRATFVATLHSSRAWRRWAPATHASSPRLLAAVACRYRPRNARGDAAERGE